MLLKPDGLGERLIEHEPEPVKFKHDESVKSTEKSSYVDDHETGSTSDSDFMPILDFLKKKRSRQNLLQQKSNSKRAVGLRKYAEAINQDNYIKSKLESVVLNLYR